MSSGTALAEIFVAMSRNEKEAALRKILEDGVSRQLLAEMVFGVSTATNPLSSARRPDGTELDPVDSQSVTPRERGKRTRNQYVLKLMPEGITLKIQEGVLAATPGGQRVALPFAREINPNAWFLGLRDDHLRNLNLAVVLLCETSAGEVLDFILPPDMVGQFREKLSLSKGHRKFNVRRNGDTYYLRLAPQGTRLDISEYKSNISCLGQ